jgi:putative ABC transport system permease protein
MTVTDGFAVVPWLRGLWRRRTWYMIAASLSIAVTIAFGASLGSFISSSRSSLTARASQTVAVDWQVQVTPQGSPQLVGQALHAVPGVVSVVPVSYAKVLGLSSSSAGSIRTTGTAVIVSLPANYTTTFPKQLRYLVGHREGVLIAQQTAANLGAAPGSTIDIHLANGLIVHRFVGGVVDLPQADSFFQVVGTAPGAGASAPPDNVIFVPPSLFASSTNGSAVIRQFHVRLDHSLLPSDPAAAYQSITNLANHFSLTTSGGALIGDNLGASLLGAREDALYAELLFLLLGLPGLALAISVIWLVVGLRAADRRREVGLLLLRGANRSTILAISMVEAVSVAVLGALVGLALGALSVRAAFSHSSALATSWTVAACGAGLAISILAHVVPAIKSTSTSNVAIIADTAKVTSTRPVWFVRMRLDFALLGAAAIIALLSARNNFQIVVVPEGVPVASIDYAALLAPALAWPGLLMLTWRVTATIASHRTGRFARSPGDTAPELVAASIRRRRQIIARGTAGLAAAVGLGVSTAVFTATYDRQARLDVSLTVGADVAATIAPGTHATIADLNKFAKVVAVTAVQPLLHRFAYVGPDLQDLFGIQPQSIATATTLQNAFTPGSSIASVLSAMTQRPDGVLLAAETIQSYQLHQGDLINLRVLDALTGKYVAVPFHVVGTIKEFPTAPKDSFIVANLTYLQHVTHDTSISTFLMSSTNPPQTAASLRKSLGVGWQVNDIVSSRTAVATVSGLAATDLSGLARLELGYALLFTLVVTALTLGLGIIERRRALVVLGVLGATRRQRSAFLAGEGRLLIGTGVVTGIVIGMSLGFLLIKLLTGIFDPPPEGMTVPGTYVGAIILAALVAGFLSLSVLNRWSARVRTSDLRDL